MIFATKHVLLYPGRQSMILWPLLYNPVQQALIQKICMEGGWRGGYP